MTLKNNFNDNSSDIKVSILNAIHFPDENGLDDVERLKQILQSVKGRNIGINKSVNKHGRTLLHEAILRENYSATKLLLELGSNVNLKDHDGKTPLHYAADENLVDIAGLLIESGARLNVKDAVCQSTPLHRAAFFGNEKAVKLLLEKGAKINPVNEFKETPLHEAAEDGYIEIVKLLINNGANCNMRDCRNRTPFDKADFFHKEVAALIKEASFSAPKSKVMKNKP